MLIHNQQTMVKQLSEFDITKVKFIDGSDVLKGFISIGKESIRFWKTKRTFDEDTVMQNYNVFLGDHARENKFLDIIIMNESQKGLIVSSLGCLYILDILKKEIIGVY